MENTAEENCILGEISTSDDNLITYSNSLISVLMILKNLFDLLIDEKYDSHIILFIVFQ